MADLNYDKKKFKDLCRKYKLSLVVLHGSYRTGRAAANSDIDVGILGEAKTIKENYFALMADFNEIFGDKFDPAFLNGAESMITYHVAMDGTPLYEKNKGMFNSFKVGAIARYMDTKKFRLLEKKYISTRIHGDR